MRKIGTILLLSVLTNLCIADLPSANNAITLSLGGASATYLNAFAIENNVAALAFSKAEFSLNAANRFGLSDYSNIMAVYHHSIENTSISRKSSFTVVKLIVGEVCLSPFSIISTLIEDGE